MYSLFGVLEPEGLVEVVGRGGGIEMDVDVDGGEIGERGGGGSGGGGGCELKSGWWRRNGYGVVGGCLVRSFRCEGIWRRTSSVVIAVVLVCGDEMTWVGDPISPLS